MADPADPSRKSFHFDGHFDGYQIRGSARVCGRDVELEPVPGKVLTLPLDEFMHLFCTLVIAAHSQSSDSPA